MRKRLQMSAQLALALSLSDLAHAESPRALATPVPSSRVDASDGGASSTAPPSNAGDAFAEGLRQVREGHYESAKAAFLRAYALEPKPLVLYNVGQCEVRLGRFDAAIEALERFLREGGESIGTEQQQAVSRQLEALRAIVQQAPAAVPQPLEGPALPAETLAAPAQPLADPAARSAPEPTRPIESEPRTVAWLLSGTGAVLLGSAGVLYLWNDGRYEAWKAERAELDGLANLGTALSEDAAVWDRANRSNERLATIERLDLFSALAAGVGAVSLGVGIWQFVSHGDRSAVTLSAGSSSSITWRGTW
jgi:tetratricopeptide (TPR) repeat protein